MTTKRGFTPIEITISVLILGLLVVGIVEVYYTALERQRFNEAVEGVMSMFQKARSLTLASKDTSGGTGKQYGLHFDDATIIANPNRVVLFEGAVYNGSGIETYQLPNGVAITAVIPQPPEIYFNRITGAISPSGGFVMLGSARSGLSRSVIMYPTGTFSIL